VPNPYAALLRVRGGVAFSSAAFVARLPISMVGIGIVLLLSSTTHRYALAGAVSAVEALAEGVGQPFLSRFVDRYGQSRAVPPMVAACALATIVLVRQATVGVPAWAYFPVAVVAGATFPNVGALVRARWSAALSGTPALQTAFSVESTLDEVIFVLGPPLVTWLAVVHGPQSALFVTVAILVVGSALLLVQRSTEPAPAGPGAHAGPSALSVADLRVVFAMLLMLGGVFGSFEVVTIAYAQQHGQPGAAGLVLALNAVGSMTAGLVYGAVHPKAGLRGQLLALGLFVPVTVLPFPFLERLPVLAVFAFLAGLVIAPTLIVSFQMIERLCPPNRLTEGLTLATTAIVIGVAAAAALAGPLIDRLGTPHAYVVATGSGLLTAVVAAVGARWVPAAPARAAEDTTG
jgi:predicted MFS family arabinose efflux permease